MQRPWSDSPKVGGLAKRWVLRAFFAGVAAIIAVSVLSTFLVWQRRPPWWAGDDLPADPGYFVRKQTLDYPVCAPWQANDFPKQNNDLNGLGLRQTERATASPIAGSNQVNLGLLLPKKAKIVKIYCAIGTSALDQRECSTRHCEPPMTFFVMDSLYTRGRVLVFTLQNKTRDGTRPVGIHVWALWR
jgi:hypothetical protein